MKAATKSSLLKNVVAVCGAYLWAGMGYVVSLWLQLSLLPALLLTIFPAFLWVYGVSRFLTLQDDAGTANATTWQLPIACIILTAAACVMIKAHGEYDAWLHWNSLARYMSSPSFFAYLHQEHSLWHADYPPGLPAAIGFVWRLLGDFPEWVPRSVSFLFYLATVLLLCSAAAKVSAFPRLWLVVLMLFAFNFECLSQGLNQYADVPLSLMLLLVFMLLDSYKCAPQNFQLFLLGFFMGACMLFKNEGMMLAICVMLVYARVWLRRNRALWLLAGLFPPVVLLLLYKQYIPQSNDLLEGFGSNFWHGLVRPENYLILLRRSVRVIGGRFPLPLLFSIWCLWQLCRKPHFLKSRKLCSLILCFGGFSFIYLTTSYDIVWLTNTSFNRILMQLLPSFIYFLIEALRKAYPENVHANNHNS